MFTRIVFATSLFAAALSTTACSKDAGGASCDKVVDHQISVFELPTPSADERAGMLAKCEKIPAAARDCLLAASTLEAVQGCRN